MISFFPSFSLQQEPAARAPAEEDDRQDVNAARQMTRRAGRQRVIGPGLGSAAEKERTAAAALIERNAQPRPATTLSSGLRPRRAEEAFLRT